MYLWYLHFPLMAFSFYTFNQSGRMVYFGQCVLKFTFWSQAKTFDQKAFAVCCVKFFCVGAVVFILCNFCLHILNCRGFSANLANGKILLTVIQKNKKWIRLMRIRVSTGRGLLFSLFGSWVFKLPMVNRFTPFGTRLWESEGVSFTNEWNVLR